MSVDSYNTELGTELNVQWDSFKMRDTAATYIMKQS